MKYGPLFWRWPEASACGSCKDALSAWGSNLWSDPRNGLKFNIGDVGLGLGLRFVFSATLEYPSLRSNGFAVRGGQAVLAARSGPVLTRTELRRALWCGSRVLHYSSFEVLIIKLHAAFSTDFRMFGLVTRLGQYYSALFAWDGTKSDMLGSES